MNRDLKHIKNNNGFEVPKDYFETLEDQIITHVTLETTHSENKNQGFKTPDHYFDTLEDNILGQLETETVVKVIPLFKQQRFIYISSIAAVFLIMLAIFVSPESDTLDYQTVENYIINENVDVYELATLLTDEEFDNIEMEIMNSTYMDTDMESYLLDNANLEDLMEQ